MTESERPEARVDSEPLHSPYYATALAEVAKSAPEKVAAVKPILESADRQGIDNFSQFESPKHPGMLIPFTKVSINRVVKDAFPRLPDPTASQNAQEKKKHINVTIGGIGSGPFTPWDMQYDRNITSLGKVTRPLKSGEPVPEVEDYSIGLPNGEGGKVTKEWLEARKKDGLSAYGEPYAQLIEQIAKGENVERIVINGMSLGSSVAKELSKHLSEDVMKKTSFILDNPVGEHKRRIWSILKALQVPIGFLGEGVVRGLVDHRLKAAMKEEKPFLSRLKTQLRGKGMDIVNDEDQKDLKKKAFLQDAKDLVRGTESDTEETRMYIRRGMKDPTTFSPLRFARTLLQVAKGENAVTVHGKLREYAVNGTHFLNRYRVKNWSRIIDNCKRLDNR